MIGIRAKYIAKKTMMDDSLRITFEVPKEFADKADTIMGLPKSSGEKEYNILRHVDESTDAYEVEPANI